MERLGTPPRVATNFNMCIEDSKFFLAPFVDAFFQKPIQCAHNLTISINEVSSVSGPVTFPMPVCS